MFLLQLKCDCNSSEYWSGWDSPSRTDYHGKKYAVDLVYCNLQEYSDFFSRSWYLTRLDCQLKMSQLSLQLIGSCKL